MNNESAARFYGGLAGFVLGATIIAIGLYSGAAPLFVLFGLPLIIATTILGRWVGGAIVPTNGPQRRVGRGNAR